MDNKKFLFTTLFSSLLDIEGKRTEENPLDMMLSLPLNCWGMEYIARAAGPKKNFTNNLSLK